jgi:hypothetical protein
MRPCIEAVYDRLAIVAGLAQVVVAIAACQMVMLKDLDLLATVSQERSCGQAADPCSDNGHIAISLAVRGSCVRRETRCR